MSHLTPETVERLASAAPASIQADSEHLAQCEACRSAVKDARGRQQLLRGLTPYTLSDMAFRRVEARLSEQVEDGLPSAGLRWLWWLVPVTAAAALVAFLAVRVPATELTPVRSPQPVELAKAPFSPLTVVFASADAKVREADGSWRAVEAGEVLGEGTALSGRRVLLAPDSALSQRFEASGLVALGGQATIALGAGSLAVQVHGAPVVISAGPRRINATEAVFLVSRAAAEVVLELSTGHVEVSESSSETRASFSAPAKVRWADDTPLRRAQSEGTPAALPVAVPPRPWAKLDLSGLPLETAVAIDGQEMGVTPFSLLLDVGRHRLLITPKGEPSREQWIELVGGKAAVLAWPPPTTLTAKEPREPEPDAASLRRVMEDLQRQRPKLAACYEKWLKANPAASGEVELVLSVSAKGVVRNAEVNVKGDPISPESSECLVRTARTLVLSPLGMDQDIAVPLRFTPRGR